MATVIPEEINLHQQSAYLTLKYSNQSYDLTAEYLRVHSPSAEVMGSWSRTRKTSDRKRECFNTKHCSSW